MNPQKPAPPENRLLSLKARQIERKTQQAVRKAQQVARTAEGTETKTSLQKKSLEASVESTVCTSETFLSRPETDSPSSEQAEEFRRRDAEILGRMSMRGCEFNESHRHEFRRRRAEIFCRMVMSACEFTPEADLPPWEQRAETFRREAEIYGRMSMRGCEFNESHRHEFIDIHDNSDDDDGTVDYDSDAYESDDCEDDDFEDPGCNPFAVDLLEPGPEGGVKGGAEAGAGAEEIDGFIVVGPGGGGL